MKKLISTLCLLGILPSSCTPVTVNNTPVSKLDLDRYLGDWYEIARFDHSFERGLTHARASYYLLDDGLVRVVNSGMKNGNPKRSVGKAKTTAMPGLLRVSFFGPFYSDYRVLMVTDDYSRALVGSGTDDYLWILSRTPEIPEDEMKTILDEAASRGYRTENLIWVTQAK